MIGYLEGKLRHLDATRALVMAGGVGYDVHISASTYYRLEGKSDAALEIYTHVREDAIALYGFATGEEKFAFERLIAISGIGPTLAQKILSGIEVPDLVDAIARGDARKLSTIPGVGRKTADRICLELRDKLVLAETADSAARPAAHVTIDDDVASALVNLGYRPKDAENAIAAARKELGGEADIPALLRAALRQLTR
ncbi:MAG TPA: Holliday junction branch migration protein RuvA [Thermoanaerobaculia bacterium]|nr:Holliday junction branch migration protein RuvA [Thermoanaerobaculia bacterium]